MRELSRLLKKVGIRRKYLFLLLLRAPFDSVRTWMLAGLMKSVFRCLETEHSGNLPEICVYYGLICAMLFLYNGTVWSCYAVFSAKAEMWLQKHLLEKILGLPLKRVERHFSGEWMTKLNSDVQAAFTMMNAPMNIPHLVVASINTLFSSLLLFRSSLLLFTVTWILFLPQLFLSHKIILKSMPGWKEESQNAMSESTSAVKPLITDAETVVLYQAGNLLMKKCDGTSRELLKSNMKMHRRNAANNGVMLLFGLCGYLFLLFLGHTLISGGEMLFSDVVYCFQVRGSVLGGVMMINTCLNNIKLKSVCIKRLQETMD